MKYALEKYDFRNYLLDTLKDTRQEELIFWKNTIPMPVDLLYEIFEKRGTLLKKYLDHIGAACLYGYAAEKEGRNQKEILSGQPTKENIPEARTLKKLLGRHMEKSRVRTLLKELAEMLLLNDYAPDEDSLVSVLCHDGRKYKRLYLPAALRTEISGYFPEVLEHIAVSNADMFSNVVADELHIYRMGFADAFSGIFNKLIDFVLEHSRAGNDGRASASAYRITGGLRKRELDGVPVVYGRVGDGSIWEPVWENSLSTFVLNSMHPFCDRVKSRGNGAEEVFATMVQVMAELENESLNNTDIRVLERFRQDLSRRLRLAMEKNSRGGGG